MVVELGSKGLEFYIRLEIEDEALSAGEVQDPNKISVS